MKKNLIRKSNGDNPSDRNTGIGKITVAADKIAPSLDRIKRGIDNYSLFQCYPFFRWPAWVGSSEKNRNPANTVSPPILLNKSLNQWVTFSSFISAHELRVDPSGMITSSAGRWGLEFWVIQGGRVFFPQDSLSGVSVEKDPQSSIITMTWKEKAFTLTASIFWIRSSINEAVCDINCTFNDSVKNTSVLLAVRPYDNTDLGTVSAMEFDGQTGTVTVDGRKALKAESKSDFVLAGNDKQPDIDVTSREDSFSSVSRKGIATIAPGFSAGKKAVNIVLRLALDDSDIPAGSLGASIDGLKKEFLDFVSMRLNNGIVTSVPQKAFNEWMPAMKSALLGLIDSDFHNNGSKGSPYSFRDSYYIMRGLHRMGYFMEAARYIENMKSALSYNARNLSFGDVINCCYTICTVTDHFIHTRETDYLNAWFPAIKELASLVIKYTGKLRDCTDISTNSFPHYFEETSICHDFALMAGACDDFSYLSRCMGIFGDEKKFNAESRRLQEMIMKCGGMPENEFFYSAVFAGYPFALSGCAGMASGAVEGIKGHFSRLPINVRSLGIDMFSSIIIASNMVYNGDSAALDFFSDIHKTWKGQYSLPEIVDPHYGNGSWGNGCSKICSAEMFSLLRNMIFIDLPERLVLFPLPVEGWFSPGRELKVENAPSRFGPVNFRCVSTANEVQLHFDRLPKFIPPEMSINLPCSMKLQEHDDFILKKSFGNTFIINGWPSVIRFLRK